MEVTIFKDLKHTLTPFIREVDFIFDRIKKGASKELVEKIRAEEDQEKVNILKSKLPAICFCGRFKNRADNAIIEHSGLVCLDFDKYKSIDILNQDVEKYKKDKYTYSLFISPSGIGIKLLVKIPKEIENHCLYFDALKEYYENPHFDVSSRNISRICFESYDPNLFINENSEIWINKKENEDNTYLVKKPTLKLENENEIINRLFVWFNKNYSFSKGGRNHNLFILASSFSDYGISKLETYRFCSQFIEQDFSESEIKRTIDSAYSKCSSNFGMKYFEDIEKTKLVINEIKKGKSFEDISSEIKNLDKDAFISLKQDATINDFWEFTKKGSVIINNYNYKTWLQQNGFYKYYPEGAEGYIFIRLENNLIDNTTEEKLKDFVLSEMLKIKELKVYEYLTSNPKYFKEDYLNLLDNINVSFKEDTIEEGYIYFKNCAVEVTKENINVIDYLDLNGFVWKKHIIDFDYILKNDLDCDFKKFINLVSNKEKDRTDSLESTIGFLMHSFKNSANNKAVILNDETISENPNGGSGKGIFWNALSKVKRVADINGKSFSFDKTFPYQTITADTQIIVFDDVSKNFKFENLFSVITEGITLEKKNKDAVKIPIEKSPKIIITTNYTIGGVGGSFERRKWELEFSSYFSAKYTPLNEFNRLLFDEWNSEEWLTFYNYMIFCLQKYLKNGLIKHNFHNLETRKFIKETSFEFYEWVADADNIEFGIRLYRSTLFNKFIDEYPDYKKWLSNKKFSQWIDSYVKNNNYESEKGKDMTGRYILIENNVKKNKSINFNEILGEF